MSTVVYWLRHPDHTDMFTQGYVGVSSDHDSRWLYHKKHGENAHLRHAIKKYGWDNLIKEVILIADKAYCLMIEAKLRAEDKIGWNIVKGGGNPPSSLGKKFTRSQEYKDKQRLAKLGHKHTLEVKSIIVKHLIANGMNTRFQKGQPSPRLGMKNTPYMIEAVRKAHLGKKLTQEHKDKISKANIGRKMSDDNKEKLRIANMNRIPSMKGKQYPQITCPYCDKMGGLSGMKSWHFDNCKFKENT